MKNNQPIVFIYPKDVCVFTRKSLRHAGYLLDKIRLFLGKEKHQPITIAEFCSYMDLDEDDVIRALGI